MTATKTAQTHASIALSLRTQHRFIALRSGPRHAADQAQAGTRGRPAFGAAGTATHGPEAT